MAKRLQKEAEELMKNPFDFGSVEQTGDDLFNWTGMIFGPPGTPYEGGVFNITIACPTEYPFKPPEVRFTTTVYHPNIKQDTGEICAEIIKSQWKPTLNIRWVMTILHTLLQQPNADSPLEAEIAQLLVSDPAGFKKKAAEMTAKYAN